MRAGLLVVLALSGDLSCRGQARPSERASSGPDQDAVEIEYRSMTRFPTCRGNERVRIDREGRVFKASNLTECPPGERFSTPYPAQPGRVLSAAERRRLAALVRRSGFFDLPSHYSDPKRATTDGRVEEIEVTLGPRHHIVAMENTTLPAFSEVRQAVLDAAR